MKELAKKIKMKENAVERGKIWSKGRGGEGHNLNEELDEIRTESDLLDGTTTINRDVLLNLDKTTAKGVNFEMTQ